VGNNRREITRVYIEAAHSGLSFGGADNDMKEKQEEEEEDYYREKGAARSYEEKSAASREERRESTTRKLLQVERSGEKLRREVCCK